jgi:hypothetical protein
MSSRQTQQKARKTLPQGVKALKRPPKPAASSKAPAAKRQRHAKKGASGGEKGLVEQDTAPVSTEQMTRGEKLDPEDSEGDSDESMGLEELSAFVMGDPDAEALDFEPPSPNATGYFPKYPAPEISFGRFKAEDVGEEINDEREPFSSFTHSSL